MIDSPLWNQTITGNGHPMSLPCHRFWNVHTSSDVDTDVKQHLDTRDIFSGGARFNLLKLVPNPDNGTKGDIQSPWISLLVPLESPLSAKQTAQENDFFSPWVVFCPSNQSEA